MDMNVMFAEFCNFTDSGNILAIEQTRIDFNENNQPFIKETNETAATSDTVSEPPEQDPVLDNSAQNSLFDSSTHWQQDEQDTVLDNSAQNSLFDSSTHWQHDETLALISAVEARYEDLYHPKKRRWFWDVISESLSSDGINFEAKKCKKKTYKNTKDKKNKSGRCPVRFVYFDRLDELLGEKPNNCSPHTIDVGASTSSQAIETQAFVHMAKRNLPSSAVQENYHVTAEDEERIRHKTPEREFSDFDDDNDIADPDYPSGGDSMSRKKGIKKGRKRKRNEEKWKKNLTKQKRLSGLEYTTDSGNRLMGPKLIKPACGEKCKLVCSNRIPEETRKTIHKNFWSPSKTVNVRRQYIASRVKQMPVKWTRERTGERHGKRTFTNHYSFEIKGFTETVCKTFFLNTLSISHQTVETAIKKKKGGGIVTPDKRGKHEPVNKIPEEVRNSVRTHIAKFPTYESHYCREKTKKRYLGNHLNISKMYSLYLEDCEEKGRRNDEIAKEWLYSDIFNYEYNYSFKSPDTDTCDICDRYKIRLQDASSSDLRIRLQTEYDHHLKDANDRYMLKAEDKKKSRTYILQQKVVMIDLQKCLPTPELHNYQSFYSLKLWIFTLTIHDSTIERSFCMMWDEGVASRGGNEVSSCLIKWLENNVSTEVIWSDNCPSQNRNILMIMCYFWALHLKPNLQVINHKFLSRGYTHLEADSIHSVIERSRRKVPQFEIVTPWDWQQMVRMAGTKK
nr:unnamed protein product [Callosobruchus analis]